MAGKRRQRDILNVLDQLAAETMPHEEGEEPAVALDYVLDWVGEGHTMTALATKISGMLGYEVFRGLIYKSLRQRTPNVTELIQARRAEDAAHSLVEQAQDIIDDPTNTATRERLQHAKQRAEFRQWRAKTLAPNDYGDKKTVDVNINLPAAHLAALRRVNEQRTSALEEGRSARVDRAHDTNGALLGGSVPNETVIEAVFEEEA